MMSGGSASLSPESAFRGSVQQSVGSQRRFANHVDSLLLRGRAVCRAFDNEDVVGEVSSRNPGNEVVAADRDSLPKDQNQVAHSQALLRTNGWGGSQCRSGTAAQGAGILGTAGQYRLGNLPARSRDPRRYYPGRYWKLDPNIGDEVSSASIGNVGGKIQLLEQKEALVEADMRRKKGKAILEASENCGTKQKFALEGMGESYVNPTQKLLGNGLQGKEGVSAQFIPGK
ncbi:hypothetical protein CCACVL1_25348 [Corchorus capsularis]|uniref:Uncharacterized protein n=1 Tax=Corchorus capsularis TaxID=210143 RepID=A0A1R3GL29_COCAP|nr:hypothetical protein CCACVL1_25348 [Corchorus capsularis]